MLSFDGHLLQHNLLGNAHSNPKLFPWFKSKQSGTCSNLLLRSIGKLYNSFQRCLQDYELFGDSLHQWVLKFFQHFLVAVLVLAHPECSTPSTDTQNWPWNLNAIQKLLSRLEKFFRNLTKHFQVFSSRFAKLYMKLDVDDIDMLLNCSTHRRCNETQSPKPLMWT